MTKFICPTINLFDALVNAPEGGSQFRQIQTSVATKSRPTHLVKVIDTLRQAILQATNPNDNQETRSRARTKYAHVASEAVARYLEDYVGEELRSGSKLSMEWKMTRLKMWRRRRPEISKEDGVRTILEVADLVYNDLVIDLESIIGSVFQVGVDGMVPWNRVTMTELIGHIFAGGLRYARYAKHAQDELEHVQDEYQHDRDEYQHVPAVMAFGLALLGFAPIIGPGLELADLVADASLQAFWQQHDSWSFIMHLYNNFVAQSAAMIEDKGPRTSEHFRTQLADVVAASSQMSIVADYSRRHSGYQRPVRSSTKSPPRPTTKKDEPSTSGSTIQKDEPSSSENDKFGAIVPDSYIVVLKEGHTVSSFKPYFDVIRVDLNELLGRTRILRAYKSIQGFHATLSPAMYDKIKLAPQVEYIEEDKVSEIAAEQDNPPWGLCRISERNLNLMRPYYYPNEAGKGVVAYVIDTGVYVDHLELRGRARFGQNFVPGSPDGDENGHGTHVAAIIGGTTYGVAKLVRIVDVKAFNRSGHGNGSQTLASLDWVLEQAQQAQRHGYRSVVNMSITSPFSKTINRMVDMLYAANIPIIAAAGNKPDCSADRASPSSSQYAYVVAATDNRDRPYHLNSRGNCIRMYAPGVDIPSAGTASPTANRIDTGTSMAAAHVTGVAAIILSLNPTMTVPELFAHLELNGTEYQIIGLPGAFPNIIVYNM